MNLYAKLCERAAQGRPLRIGLIGAGKFGAMYRRFHCGGRRARTQVAAALRPVYARDGVGLLRPDARAGTGGWAEPQVVFEGDTEYIRRCFTEYGVRTDPSGRYACLYKRWHLIGLEVGISVAAVSVGHEPTGCPTGFRADAVATAKRALTPGELLDGEGGYTVVGRLMPAADSLRAGALPLGLAHGWKLAQPVAAGEVLRWKDVAADAANSAVRVRREMEQTCAAQPKIVVT